MAARIYIGNLPSDVRDSEVEDVFARYGRIRSLDIKSGGGRAFAFVEYDDSRDADDAVRAEDGRSRYGSERLRVRCWEGELLVAGLAATRAALALALRPPHRPSASSPHIQLSNSRRPGGGVSRENLRRR